MKHPATCLLILLATVVAGCGDGESGQGDADNMVKVGASFADKTEVDMASVPANVLLVARATRPDVDFARAEREVRNGVVYYDVEGAGRDGEEIELDIMQGGAGWRVVEIQRDIEWASVPEAVREALQQNVPGAAVPARIIESDQTDGTIIYEFFFRSETGVESKHEVRFDGKAVAYLTTEAPH